MKRIVPALAAVFVATLGASSVAQAAVHTIDFSANATGGHISYTGVNLKTSTAVDFDGAVWKVSTIFPGDESGLAPNDILSLTPMAFTYGSGSGPVTLVTPIIKTWDGADGPFTEKLTTLEEIDRGLNLVAFVFSGTVTGGAFFTDTPATLQISLNQAGGPGRVVSASLTNEATSAVPEPATWVMMGLGFAALGYAAVRRSSKDRSAVAMV